MTNLLNCHDVYFTPYNISDAQLFPSAGIYMLCRRDYKNKIHILYIGETENFSLRLGATHEHWAEALALGMNEIHLHFTNGSKQQRLNIETRLRNHVVTPLNRQGNSGLFGLIGS